MPDEWTRPPAFPSGAGGRHGMAIAIEPDAVSDVPGRYGWDGGYGTSWFTHPARGRIGILLTQTSNVLWNGTTQEFAQLALRA